MRTAQCGSFDMDGIFGLAFEGITAVIALSSPLDGGQHPWLTAGFSMYLSSDP